MMRFETTVTELRKLDADDVIPAEGKVIFHSDLPTSTMYINHKGTRLMISWDRGGQSSSENG